MFNPTLTPAQPQRFWNKVDRSGGPNACWPWRGKRSKTTGYGQFRLRFRKETGPHRIAYLLINGPFPAALLVCHSCDAPLCCNPAYHFLGTKKLNSQDAMAKDQLAKGEDNASAKLTEANVREIRAAAQIKEPQRQIARSFGITQGAVSNIVRKATWKHIV